MSEEIKVSEMVQAETVNSKDIFMIIQNEVNKKIKAEQIKKWFNEDLNEKITKATTYSTSEVNTGKKWINGQDIYSRVLIGTKTSADLSIKVGDNIDEMFIISAKLDGAGHYVLPFYEQDSVFCRIELDGDNIKIKGGASNYSQGTVTVTVEYTKQEA